VINVTIVNKHVYITNLNSDSRSKIISAINSFNTASAIATLANKSILSFALMEASSGTVLITIKTLTIAMQKATNA
jgi:hypothetical protein